MALDEPSRVYVTLIRQDSRGKAGADSGKAYFEVGAANMADSGAYKARVANA